MQTALTAPSGANNQPWHFVVVADPAVKEEVRAAAEREEELFYSQRANEEYLRAIEPMCVSPVKPHLTDAPYLIAIFQQPWVFSEEGEKEANYYVRESVGIALGFLLVALHAAGLAALPYAPAPMGFLKTSCTGLRTSARSFSLPWATQHPRPGFRLCRGKIWWSADFI